MKGKVEGVLTKKKQRQHRTSPKKSTRNGTLRSLNPFSVVYNWIKINWVNLLDLNICLTIVYCINRLFCHHSFFLYFQYVLNYHSPFLNNRCYLVHLDFVLFCRFSRLIWWSDGGDWFKRSKPNGTLSIITS